LRKKGGIRAHHRRIDRIAAVTDNHFLKIASELAGPFAHPEIRVFDEQAQARTWLREQMRRQTTRPDRRPGLPPAR
jgi:hypothetical protein